MRQPRVLMVVGAYYPELAGGSLQCRTLMQALHDRVAFAVLTTTGDRRLPVNDRIDGVPVHRVFVDPGRLASKISGTWRLLRLAPRLAKTVDIFHFHGFTQKMLMLVALARLFGRSTIEKMTSLGWDDPVAIRSHRLGRWLQAAQMAADRLVAVNPAFVDRCRAAGVPDKKISLIPNGVDIERFVPADPAGRDRLRARLQLPAGVPLVTFVGFWSPEKGPDVLFDAWRMACGETQIAAALVFIGSTDPRHPEVSPALVARVRQQVERDRLASRVFFVERAENIADFLRASDIFAVPSSREGLSNALLEAMAAGLPCIVGSIPMVSDAVINDCVNGFIVPPRDVTALARCLSRLLSDAKLRSTTGRRARETVVERC